MKNGKTRRNAMIIGGVLGLVILCLAVAFNIKTSKELRAILEDSIKSQLLSTCFAAREIIERYPFESYNSTGDIDEDYLQLRQDLRDLAKHSGADYIYALKIIDGEYMFALDSDPVDEEVFIPYQPAGVHLAAFEGIASAGVMNVVDIYGSFNSGAAPLYRSGRVIGIVSVDIEDAYLQKSIDAAARNAVLLVIVLAAAIFFVLVFFARLLKKLHSAQQEMEHLAHHDTITGLTNRQYLFESLESLSLAPDHPFALFFIDLDNFKSVNDNAGHDAGDDLLRYVAKFLQSRYKNAKSFRPSAGMLNVSARVGGDEFIQILPDIRTEEEAAAAAKALVADFCNDNFNRYIERYNVGLSVGAALFPYHSGNPHVLIRYADIAMYRAKRAGKNQFRVYSDDMDAEK